MINPRRCSFYHTAKNFANHGFLWVYFAIDFANSSTQGLGILITISFLCYAVHVYILTYLS